MKRPIPLIKETIKSLKKRLKETKIAQYKLKLKMLVLLKKGKMDTRQEVSKELSVHYNTVGRWLNFYETGGIKSLLEIKPSGAPKGQVSLPQEVVENLKEQLNNSEGFSSYNRIKDWLKEKHNIDIKYKTLYRIVRYELKAKAKVPRKSNEKKTKKE